MCPKHGKAAVDKTNLVATKVLDQSRKVCSYRNAMSILIFEAEVVHLQETQLLANLVEEDATQGLRLQKII